MKKIIVGFLAVLAITLGSCKSNTEKEAEIAVKEYEDYADSISKLSFDNIKTNWKTIENEFAAKGSRVDSTLITHENRVEATERINVAKSKYNEILAEIEADLDEAANPTDGKTNRSKLLRDAYFKNANVGENLDFSWVNKDNILSVYQNFVAEFDRNKNTYSREDFDKIKMMYEALDTQKNQVEKEGLSSEDNRKIAALKFKFGPTFKWERMGAKSDENADAKE